MNKVALCQQFSLYIRANDVHRTHCNAVNVKTFKQDASTSMQYFQLNYIVLPKQLLNTYDCKQIKNTAQSLYSDGTETNNIIQTINIAGENLYKCTCWNWG